jgi:hypothetical protein
MKFKYLLIIIFFFLPSTLFAADVDITCYPDRAPDIVKNTYPLFQLTSFLPGSSALRTIYVENTDTSNDCRIYFIVNGVGNILTDKIKVNVSEGLFSDSLTEYMSNTSILMANLSPGENVTRTITMELPTDSGNTYASKQASFDITIKSEWGDDTEIIENGEVRGVTDTLTDTKKSMFSFLTDLIGIEGRDSVSIGDSDLIEEEPYIDSEKEILGEEDNKGCTEKTLWWVPIVIQLFLTILIVVVNVSVLKNKYIKFGVSIILAFIGYIITKKIGCGCNPVWICKNHWMLNSLIGILPLVSFFKGKRSI